MSYYIRYILSDAKEVTLLELEEALQQVNPNYALAEGILTFDNQEHGHIEINVINDGIFEDDIELLKGFAEEKENKDSLLAILKVSKSMVTVQPIWKDRDDEETLEMLEPMFDWLIDNRVGLLAVEGGSFFNSDGPIT